MRIIFMDKKYVITALVLLNKIYSKLEKARVVLTNFNNREKKPKISLKRGKYELI